MNLGVVAMLTTVLASPALMGLADGSVDPDQAGIRLLLALLAAAVAERLGCTFVNAVKTTSGTVDSADRADDGTQHENMGSLRRRASD